MNDSPGWVSPGSSPSDRSPDGEDTAPSPEETPTPRSSPENQQPRNWSAQQPPAAGNQGWGAPPPPPPPGPTGQQGWGNWNGGWNQPPAAKPGVVPLRPLGVGEILDGTVATMRAHWRTVLGISLALAVIVQLVATVSTGLWLRDTSSLAQLSKDPDPDLDQVTRALSGLLGSSGISAVVGALGTVLATAMLTMVISRAVLGRTVSMGEAWRGARPQLPRLLGLMIAIPLAFAVAVAIGSAPGIVLLAMGSTAPGVALLLVGLLAGTVAGVWLWINFSLAAPALMLEKQGIVTAMRRSAKLVRGSWWRVFGIQLLATILVVIVSSVVQMPATFIGMLLGGQGVSPLTGTVAAPSWSVLIVTGIGAVVASTIAFPIRAGVAALIYLDQRIRREALDLELARAAGISGYGSQRPYGPTPGG